jgi:hypothetical protein
VNAEEQREAAKERLKAQQREAGERAAQELAERSPEFGRALGVAALAYARYELRRTYPMSSEPLRERAAVQALERDLLTSAQSLTEIVRREPSDLTHVFRDGQLDDEILWLVAQVGYRMMHGDEQYARMRRRVFPRIVAKQVGPTKYLAGNPVPIDRAGDVTPQDLFDAQSAQRLRRPPQQRGRRPGERRPGAGRQAIDPEEAARVLRRKEAGESWQDIYAAEKAPFDRYDKAARNRAYRWYRSRLQRALITKPARIPRGFPPPLPPPRQP